MIASATSKRACSRRSLTICSWRRVGVAAAIARVDDLERDITNERKLCQSLKKQSRKTRLKQQKSDLLRDTCSKFKQSESDLRFVGASKSPDIWATRGPTQSSIDKEHRLFLAREENDKLDSIEIATFEIYPGQRSCIDRINRARFSASPGANGVDIRQTAKTQALELISNQTDQLVGDQINALLFLRFDSEKRWSTSPLISMSQSRSLSPQAQLTPSKSQTGSEQGLEQRMCLTSLCIGAATAAKSQILCRTIFAILTGNHYRY
ncbi:uncharacterized protein PHALS_08269 [Plasmopara halstedii]|uniref:Uncharacterized protein n=1 Tax=Plasmopara halstedii TaxID=4781 RepID=A0A0P1ABP8_PLAHL|nr:uncharacterized protein PHALS_08269 [Plasmopara halstedii]CEG38181.1 hypothetical protein PHALS_08269 [Plasmopara halstedii]|eukprot:XP_024574550.1 hypothetical protein PHALS_08269 [Plasmopara halstedii]